MEEEEIGWTIYDHPKDYPHHWAVRRWMIDDGKVIAFPVACLCDSLEEAREQIPVGTICFPREPEDDLVIVESWW